ncbi:hypothetical protein [Cupriavidus plantarum]|uniref:Uncharacterized protein n=1 Tax=Cupriavidus plantarum TaxID=942865 RepID=A0A316F1A0_9BURK|nr:hypothetical protein [Cupriavidus plantarum]NYH98485.1 hypothetical protein [Cupriavidus plantarum]PWK37885.1 hypothetical protein C7419_1011772 [Cupriavidus plantarum]REF01416.1 hypothetical protein C7418_0193 [Cupriavidus plantarum]RLK45725.1 hypothetical protein C7417_1749 [Cupriavidus plantarum]CAG2127921.1 hypothetical protein LMG26296_00966 [Cupriavidus plantarum]
MENNATSYMAIIQAHREMLSLAFALIARDSNRDLDGLLTALSEAGRNALTSPNIPAEIPEIFSAEVLAVLASAKKLTAPRAE